MFLETDREAQSTLVFRKGLNSARDWLYRKMFPKNGHCDRSASIIAVRVYLNKKNVLSRRKEKHQFFNDLDCYIVKSSRSLKRENRFDGLSFERVGVEYSELRKLPFARLLIAVSFNCGRTRHGASTRLCNPREATRETCRRDRRRGSPEERPNDPAPSYERPLINISLEIARYRVDFRA